MGPIASERTGPDGPGAVVAAGMDLITYVRDHQHGLRREWLAACAAAAHPAEESEADAVFGAMVDALEPNGGWWLDATVQSLAEKGASSEDLARDIALLRRVIADHVVKEVGVEAGRTADLRLADAVGSLLAAIAGPLAIDAAPDGEPTRLPDRAALERDLRRWLPDPGHNRLMTLAVATLCGPAAGDVDAVALAEAIRRCLRSGDVAYRIGPRDFALVLASTGRHGARAMLNRVADLGAPAFVWTAVTSLEGPHDGPGLLAETEARHAGASRAGD